MGAIKLLPWRWIAPALAVAGALWFAFDTGRDNMQAKLQPRIDLLTGERDAARANVATLSDALAKQNDAIAAQGRVQDRIAKASDKAIRSGAERRGALDAGAARVEAVRPAAGVCGAVPGDVRGLWEQL